MFNNYNQERRWGPRGMVMRYPSNYIRPNQEDKRLQKASSNRRLRCVIVASIFIIGALSIGIVLTAVLKKEGQENESYPGEAKIEGTFTEDLNNMDSIAFKLVENDFCGKMNILMQQSVLSDGYAGCEVTSIRKGSLIITFKIIMKHSTEDDAVTQIKIRTVLESNMVGLGALRITMGASTPQEPGTITDNCVSSPCANGGTCFNGLSGFICKCTEGFDGDTCTSPSTGDTDYCFGNPCKNGGTCYKTNRDYFCVCETNWKGINCTEASCAHGFSGTPCKECNIGTYKPDEGTANCTPCPKGSTTANTGAISESQCNLCLEGYGPGDFGCVKCLPGTYKENIGSHDCADCDEGTFSKKDGQRECNSCLAGTFSTRRQNSCTQCPRGTYNDQSEQPGCRNCSAGLVSNSKRTGCMQCPEGTYSEEGWESCSKCEAGTYSSIKGQERCNPCDTGSASRSKGQQKCDLCPQGTFTNKTGQADCTTCEAGTYNNIDGANDCIPCSAGKSTGGGQKTCQTCLQGTFSNEEKNLDCTQCAAGTSNNGVGRKNCTLCDAGKISGKGQSECNPCPAGTYSTKGQKECFPCPRGTFSKTEGSASCEDCNPGEYNNATGQSGCKQCGDKTYAPVKNKTTECLQCQFEVTGDGTMCECTSKSCNWCPPNGWDAGQPSIYVSFDSNCKKDYSLMKGDGNNITSDMEEMDGSMELEMGVAGEGVKTESTKFQFIDLSYLANKTCYTGLNECQNGVTVSFWINSAPTNFGIPILTTSGEETDGIVLILDQSGFQKQGKNTEKVITENFDYISSHDTWIHMTLVQKTFAILFVNGVKKVASVVSVKNPVQSVVPPGNLIIGRKFTEKDGDYGTLKIDELTVFDLALNSDQVTTLYNMHKDQAEVINNN